MKFLIEFKNKIIGIFDIEMNRIYYPILPAGIQNIIPIEKSTDIVITTNRNTVIYLEQLKVDLILKFNSNDKKVIC